MFKRVRAGVLVVWITLIVTPLFSETIDQTIPPEPPIKTTTPPQLGSTEKPNYTYRAGEVIPYRIRVIWPENPENARMNSPELELENLELTGVSQEAVAADQELGGSSQIAQSLTFQFKGLKQGPASIKKLQVRWTLDDGLSTSALTIPAVDLKILNSKEDSVKLLILFIGIPACLLLAIALFFLIRSSEKRKAAAKLSQKTLEEAALSDLENRFSIWKTEKNSKESLRYSASIFKEYLHQKLDWNQQKEDYNVLLKKAEFLWPKKEASEIGELLKTLEYERFSGASLAQEEIEMIYRSVHSFIERKNVSETT